MGPGRLFWKLFFGNVLLMALVLVTCVWLIGREVERFQDHELTRTLELQAIALREIVEERFDADHAAGLDQLVKHVGQAQQEHARITLVLADGTVLADSEADPRSMESHADRPEVTKALLAGSGEDTRLSHTLNRMMRYVAISVGPEDLSTHRPTGVVRVAMPVRTISEQAGSMQRLIWGTGLLVLAAAVVLALGLAQLWSRPIRRITLAARSLLRGDLSTTVNVGGTDELAGLARSLNEMRERLAEQLETIDRQRRTLESLLAQLHEGVIVAGPEGRIVLINPAAVRMLGLRIDSPKGAGRLPGQAVEECVPRHELQQMLLPQAARGPAGGGGDGADTIREVRLPLPDGGSELAVLAHASDIVLPSFGPGEEPPAGPRPQRPGRLLVLTDVTQLTRLIQVKADFAANASHELRTPLAAIRAALETLLPLDFAEEADSARHFIDVIDRHSRRLELMVSDLLELSRLETSRAQFQPTEVRLRETLADVYGQHADDLAQKKLQWTADLPAGLNRVWANPHLLRVVLDNLVDNSIKFTEPGGRVSVTCRETPSAAGSPHAVAISVSDTGCGIAPEEQDRVFERFYQVERARSGGVLRGTGLGLSIVRHAVAAMKGTVELQSEPGNGTQITITLPQASPKLPGGRDTPMPS